MTLELLSWPTTLQPFALVASPRLGLQQTSIAIYMKRNKSYLGPLSQPKKIKDYYIEEFECFNFKLEEQKQNKKKHP
jgi:hypothetical protein